MANTKNYSLSEYDEKLNSKAKEGILSAKADYAKAEAVGDTVGMAKANAQANRIRKQYGGYTGGTDGSSYYPVEPLQNAQRPKYTSSYSKAIENVQDDILSRDEFSFNLESDPMYQLYKKVYTKAGNDAYDRALAQGAIKTGGIASTNAVSAATQAQSYYNSLLADKATDLYNNAYNRYLDSIEGDYNKLNMLSNAESKDYMRYRDDVSDYEADRSYDYNMYRDDYNDVANEMQAIADMAYRKQRDAAEDDMWKQEFDYTKQRDAQTDSYNSAKLAADMQKWQQQSELDRYSALARLIQSVYNKSNIGVNINTIMDLLGM